MPTHPTVAINNDLATGYSRIAFRAAYHKRPVGLIRYVVFHQATPELRPGARLEFLEFLCLASAACCVETTMAETRTACGRGIQSNCVLAAGEARISPLLHNRVSSRDLRKRGRSGGVVQAVEHQP